MLEILTILSLLIGGSGTAIVSNIEELPPRPDQSLISCRDGQWEDEYLTEVAEVKIHKTLSPLIEKALSDASQQGLALQITSGYRTCPEQQQLRSAACGVGDYNQYQKPIDLCLPPTEPAGRSLHNEGLAVDFICTGYGFFQSSPCYAWLRENGARYLLIEHRLEPWHWSTTGK